MYTRGYEKLQILTYIWSFSSHGVSTLACLLEAITHFRRYLTEEVPIRVASCELLLCVSKAINKKAKLSINLNFNCQ